MAGVDGVGLARMATPRVWRGSGAPSGFTVPDGETRSDAAHGVGAPMALGGVLGLQESADHQEGDAPARQQADTMLTELASLQRTLLGGGDPATVLGRLDDLLGTAPASGSPVLLAVLRAVRMRARVELARRSWGVDR